MKKKIAHHAKAREHMKKAKHHAEKSAMHSEAAGKMMNSSDVGKAEQKPGKLKKEKAESGYKNK